MTSLDLAPGTIFAGDFRVVERLGAGDGGASYRVVHVPTGVERVLKVLALPAALDEQGRKAFEREALVAAQIESDHVALVVSAGVDATTGLAWVAAERLEGSDLGARLARERGEPMPAGEVVTLFEQLGEALGAADRVGVVHGDLKPSNVFLASPRGAGAPFDVKVLDFGVAKLTVAPEATAAGVRGTSLWMAPEQASPDAAPTAAADVWAVGLLAFFALTGRSYWLSGRSPEVDVGAWLRELHEARRVPATERATALGAPTALPAGFDAWLDRCLAAEPELRFPGAAQACAALTAMLGQPDAKSLAPPSRRRSDAATAPRGLDRTVPHGNVDLSWFTEARPPSAVAPGPERSPALPREVVAAFVAPAVERRVGARAGSARLVAAAVVVALLAAAAAFALGRRARYPSTAPTSTSSSPGAASPSAPASVAP